MSKRSGLVTLLALALSSCGGSEDGTFLVLHLEGQTAQPIVRVELTIKVGQQTASPVLTLGGATIMLPKTASYRLPDADAAVTVDATAFAAGDVALGTVATQGTAMRKRTLDLTLTFTAGAPHLVVDRSSVDFSAVPTAQTSPPIELRITNDGTSALTGLTAMLAGAGAAAFASPDLATCQSLAPAASCTTQLSFAPTAVQGYAATLTLTGMPGGSVTIGLSGTGVMPGALSVSPNLVDFGTVVQGGQSAGLQFTVLNRGTVASGMLTTALTGVDAPQFEITADGCTGQILQADTSCGLSARFVPGATGPRRATLTITGLPGGTAVATLNGGGLAQGTIAISPTSRTLTSVLTGTQGAPVAFQISNNAGVTTGPLALTLAGSGKSDFEIVSSDCAAATLAPSTSCTAMVRLAPQSGGFKVATLTASATPGGSASAALSAQALLPAALAAVPPSSDFGTVITTTPASTTIRIRNPGDITTGALTAALSGGDLTLFSVTTDGCTTQTLAPGASCDVVVRFAPTTVGSKTTTLTVSASPGGSVNVALSGNAVLPGALTIAPTSHLFGDVVVGGTPAEHVFTVTNTGGAVTSAISVMITGTGATNFGIVDDTCNTSTLAAASTCSIRVSFAPTSAGIKGASLSVSATQGGTAVATLNGIASRPASLTLTTGTDFGSTVGGTPGLSQVFTARNTGDAASGPLVVSLTGPNASAFSITSNACPSGPLTGGTSCAITVRFTPATGVIGDQIAALDVRTSSGPGGVASSELHGAAVSAAMLTLNTMSFGTALVGTQVERILTVRNTGGASSGAITLSITGTDRTDFTTAPPSSGDCESGVTTLPGGATCLVRVRWNPAARGLRSAMLTASASPGGSPGSLLEGTAQMPVTLTSADSMHQFPLTEAGVTSAGFDWVVTNGGDFASAVPVVGKSGANFGEFTATGCTAAIPAGGSCTVSVTFTPQYSFTRDAIINVTAGTATISLVVSGLGQARITLTKTGGGRVVSSPAGIDCDTACLTQNALFPDSMSLTASVPNGSGLMFRGWGGPCARFGVAHTCSLYRPGSGTVTATFAPIDHNLVFVSSTQHPNDLGSAQAYDARCNVAATAGGINNGSNDAYVAWVSSGTSDAQARLGAARGFMRMDGLPISDRIGDTVWPLYGILHPVLYTEFGDRTDAEVRTGISDSGSLADSCNDWNQTTGTFTYGRSSTGPHAWTQFGTRPCSAQMPVYCIMKTFTASWTVPTRTGKRIWLSNTPYLPNATTTPDQHCTTERPIGVIPPVMALLGSSSRQAADALMFGENYVRIDGQLVGSYDDLLGSIPDLRTGIWLKADGSYDTPIIWTGYGDSMFALLQSNPPAGAHCNDWSSSTAGVGRGGSSQFATAQWMNLFSSLDCATPRHLVCVEQ